MTDYLIYLHGIANFRNLVRWAAQSHSWFYLQLSALQRVQALLQSSIYVCVLSLC